jgi:hypothetical protein
MSASLVCRVMNEFLYLIKGTPFYVWIILIYLLFVGIKSLNTRIVYLPKLFIIPLILLAIKYKTFFSHDAIEFFLVTILGAIGGFLVCRGNKIKIIKHSQSIEVPGNYSTLIILISFFLVKYYFGYLKAIEHDLAFKYSLVENTISGLFSGYFIGRAIRYTYKYRVEVPISNLKN